MKERRVLFADMSRTVDGNDFSRCVNCDLFPDEQGDRYLCSCRRMIDTNDTVAAGSASSVGGSFVGYDAGNHHTTDASP